MDDLSRATGVYAEITPDMIGTGTKASRSITPPGYLGQPENHAKGHLLASILGGPGDDPRNLVTLYHLPTNTPTMRTVETQIRSAVEAGDTIRMHSVPIYQGNSLLPSAVSVWAEGQNGWQAGMSIFNQGKK